MQANLTFGIWQGQTQDCCWLMGVFATLEHVVPKVQDM